MKKLPGSLEIKLHEKLSKNDILNVLAEHMTMLEETFGIEEFKLYSFLECYIDSKKQSFYHEEHNAIVESFNLKNDTKLENTSKLISKNGNARIVSFDKNINVDKIRSTVESIQMHNPYRYWSNNIKVIPSSVVKNIIQDKERKLQLERDKIIILLTIISLTSCAKKISDAKISSKENEIKLKIGPTWYDNESEIDFIYGVKTAETEKNYITEFHLNFGGKTLCNTKKIVARIDFGTNENLILSDSINQLLPATKEIIKRVRNKSNVDFEFMNPNPGILVFTIEKVNLKPNGKKNKIYLNLSSDCNQILKLPINLAKYNVENIEKLYENYITSELSKQTKDELIHKKVIFSFNETLKSGNYIIDFVDQNNMLVLTFDKETSEYLIHNTEKKLLKRIKRST